MVKAMNKRYLQLEDGTKFEGTAFGSDHASQGEIVFYAGMTGYQEILTDPTYKDKIVTMTYPLIGNYGINRDDSESISANVKGLVVKEYSEFPSNFRAEESLDEFLRRQAIPAIAGIDTRKLIRHIRQHGSMKAVLTAVNEAVMLGRENVQEGQLVHPVEETSITKPYIIPGRGKRITIVDFGIKHSLLHELMKRQCHITVVPYYYTEEEILQYKPDGIILSDGPGDPNELKDVIEVISSLLGRVPLFGIGLGHQLFALANGAKVEKLAVGLFGKGFTVRDLRTDHTWNVTQSKQFTVQESSITGSPLSVIFRNANDQSIEGLYVEAAYSLSVQFNPEGAPGPNETNYLFDEFLHLIEKVQAKGGAK